MFAEWNCNPETLEPLTDSQDYAENGQNSFSCNRCNKSYRSLKSLRRHRFHCGQMFNPLLPASEQNLDGSDAQFQCIYCNRAYRWKKGLKRHQTRCEAKMAQELPIESNLEVNIVEESVDGLIEEPIVDAVNDLGEIETDDFPVIAEGSLQTLSEDAIDEETMAEIASRKSASGIVRNRDATIGRFQCILCGKRYGWLKNLRRHQRICRKKANKLRWKECKVMLEPLSLKGSKRLSEQNFKCPTCAKEYKWLRDLRQHQSNCSKKSQNLWNVSEANKSIPDQVSQIMRKSLSAVNSNPEGLNPCFTCAFCGKAYTWRRSLRRHYLKCPEKGQLSLNILKQGES